LNQPKNRQSPQQTEQQDEQTQKPLRPYLKYSAALFPKQPATWEQTKMKRKYCSYCGNELKDHAKQILEMNQEIAQLEQRVQVLLENISAKEDGYCGTFCREQAESEA
jgi:DNA mismatch repair ATPase MutS